MSNEQIAVTDAQIHAAAIKWCGDEDHETLVADVLYFKTNWRDIPELLAFVRREVIGRIAVTNWPKPRVSNPHFFSEEAADWQSD
jgi:hypothetical protein